MRRATIKCIRFLSTPSGWRATSARGCLSSTATFLSTPSGWRATGDDRRRRNADVGISIHALRVEGDYRDRCLLRRQRQFLSTPSGWRATYRRSSRIRRDAISIHALRVEGDGGILSQGSAIVGISIHALRVEGDQDHVAELNSLDDFYPRPPGGGRQVTAEVDARKLADFYPRPPGGRRHRDQGSNSSDSEFLSTPSGWRATSKQKKRAVDTVYFYPRPPGGGRPNVLFLATIKPSLFLSTPSGWRATRWALNNRLFGQISIHALRVEGDPAPP